MFSQCSRVSHHKLYGYDKEGPSPSEEDNNFVFEPISLDKRHSIECYVLDVVDPAEWTVLEGIQHPTHSTLLF